MDLVEVKNRRTDIARHPWELARFEIVRSLLHVHIRNEEDYSVLDVGCGDIFFISNLAEHYPKVKFYAIDIAFTDEIMKQLSGSINGKNIFLFKTLDEASTHLKKPADLVLLLDVVEHIEKEVEFLSWLHNHPSISSNTVFMITVPAYQSLFCSHDHFLGHYRRYTNSSLNSTIEKAGFKK
jgi:2-polyprenyl-3-methyl-5-hydroxy-6-metoxy-1,4-benzoquinol methylase